MNSKYFTTTIFSLLDDLKDLVDLPLDFIEFFKFNSGELSIFSLKPEEVKGIGLGLELEDSFYLFGGTLNLEELKKEIKFNLMSTGLLKFANNEFSEGGFYIGVDKSNKGRIFFYKNYIDWAEDGEIILLSSTFTEFIEKLKPVGIVFTETGTEYKYLTEEVDSKGELTGLSIKPIA